MIFVDTSGILALADASDRWHAAARQAYEERVRNGETLVVTSLIWRSFAAIRRVGLRRLRQLLTGGDRFAPRSGLGRSPRPGSPHFGAFGAGRRSALAAIKLDTTASVSRYEGV